MSILPASGMGDESTGFYSETIDQSLRFNEGDNSRMSVTVGDGSGSGGGNRRTYTFSVWLKFSEVGDSFRIFEGYTSSSQYTGLGFDSSNRMRFDRLQDGVTNTVYSNAVFRDATNWYHFVWSIDTEQSTASNRVRFYVNGTELTDKGTSGSGYPVEDLNTMINASGQSTVHAIGKFGGNTNSNFSGYMAEVNFIDGLQLSPTSFGETKNGVWIPKSVSGLTYGTLGFRLTFADSSDLGNNANSTDGTNDFTTVTNLASTAVVPDSPTNNWCTWNAIDNFGAGNLTHGATKWAATSGSNEGVASTFAMPTSGKWYWEYHVQDKGYLSHIGLTSAGTVYDNTGSSDGTRASWGFGTWNASYNSNITKYTSSGGGSAGTNWSAAGNVTDGQVLACAYDADNGTLWFAKAGTFINSSGTANPATNTDPRFSGLNDGTQWFAYNTQYPDGSPDFFVNFGQDSSFAGSKTSGSTNAQDANGIGDFYYTPPSGFLALCASNLPQNTLSANQSEQATDHFNTVLYTGNGTSQSITGVGFQPDWVWAKSRDDGSLWHFLLDSSRGGNARLYSNGNGAESSSVNNITSFDADGFSVGSAVNINANNDPIVAWNWKANGGTTSSNTDGTITSTVQANQTAGFSIITYTGTGTQSDTVGHGLGVKPKVVIVKSRSEAQNWHVYHEGVHGSAPHNYVLVLNSNNDRSSSSADFMNSTAPTTSVISVGDDNSSNKSGTTYVMYAFAEVEGYSRFSDYLSIFNSNGNFIFTGFRPQWVMIKAYAGVSDASWIMYDDVRGTENPTTNHMFANLSNAETTNTNLYIDFLSNGFKIRGTNTNIGGGSDYYVFFAFARQDFKFSNAR